MCLTKIINSNHKYRSQQPNLKKLQTRFPGDSPTKYEWFLVSGFIEEEFLRIGQKLHKITHNSIKNRDSTPILTNLVGVYIRNINTKFEANPCSSSREEVNNGILHSDI